VNATQNNTAALVAKPWLLVGVSRTTWFMAKQLGETPPGVQLPGKKRPLYRVSDVLAWAEKLVKVPPKRHAATKVKPVPSAAPAASLTPPAPTMPRRATGGRCDWLLRKLGYELRMEGGHLQAVDTSRGDTGKGMYRRMARDNNKTARRICAVLAKRYGLPGLSVIVDGLEERA
jgi:hypothetical protein